MPQAQTKKAMQRIHRELRDTAHADLYLFEANHRSDKASRSLLKSWKCNQIMLCIILYKYIYNFNLKCNEII